MGLPHPAIPSPHAAAGANLSVAPFFCPGNGNLEQTARRHGDRLGLSDDQMVQHADPDQAQRLPQFAGDGLIRRARFGNTAGVVVRILYCATSMVQEGSGYGRIPCSPDNC
jgi:hypothetical protein